MSQVVVITGASAGVGRATAVEFARQGYDIALLARGKQRLEAARREIEALGVRALPISVDIADPDAVERAADEVERELGPIDVWVNNAMTTVFAPFKEITPKEFRRATEVTYLGTVYGTMAALKRMLPRDKGSIVQVGSALAYRAIPLQAPYCGAKHAVRGFTDSIRSELIHDKSKVRLSMVHLPAMNTPQFSWCKTHLPRHPQPVPPIFQPEVAARGIVWAAKHRRREVHVGRSAVLAIWGNKLFPGFGDRYLAANGLEGQQTDEPVQENRPYNLFEPVDADFGARGIFDDRASDSSWQLWVTTHRGLVTAVGAAAVLVAAGMAAWWM
ncbi:Putative oxidoreductase SadH [Maioricimonas rarisocia]|uniref:Oxidoreductase SadH n=1 Tax=Maioricimonas rarisocia TaxID=2528026 RepID=A0A517Z5B6_9PLAN|nr:SDR family oxidoreductase [Maioricimonas rarisocia]QDU37682.1 Putative oxidoreductase SadH [Maioricimonas rarisocia]